MNVYGKLEWQAGKKKDNDSIFNHFIQMRQSGIVKLLAENTIFIICIYLVWFF